MENTNSNNKAYVITGPTSGIGYVTALELAKHGTVILVGRNLQKLEAVRKTIEQRGQHAVCVVCDISDVVSARRAAAEIIALNLTIAGVDNNAGIMPMKTAKSAQGWDMTFATNHVGTFAFTEALAPHLPDGANILFVASAVEDPERKPVKLLGMKGGRFISVEASTRSEWQQPGTKMAGADAYATSKQCILASSFVMARENPRLHFNAIEPGITPGTGLGGSDANAFTRFMFKLIVKFPPFSKFKSTPEQSAQVITKILTDQSGKTGVYFNEKGGTMQGSKEVSDPKFQERVVAETRALLATV